VIQQHKAALDLALDHVAATTNEDRQQKHLTVDTIEEWHAILCGGGLDPEAGRLRTKKVRAGTADFLPPACLDQELQKFCNGIKGLVRVAVTPRAPCNICGSRLIWHT
jgi:fido (protein-threonine AMPylation protein)